VSAANLDPAAWGRLCEWARSIRAAGAMHDNDRAYYRRVILTPLALIALGVVHALVTAAVVPPAVSDGYVYGPGRETWQP
jgi:hypothetical protein